MRTIFLLSLAALAAVAAGCGSQGREQAARSLPQRDLTLAAPARQVDIASPVELENLRAQHPTLRPSRRISRRSSPIEAKPAPAAVAAVPVVVLASAPVAELAGVASEPASDRELPPGKTVTVIPASSGPSTASDWTDEPPRARGGIIGVRGGGMCPPRGRRPGIGISAFPRPHVR